MSESLYLKGQTAKQDKRVSKCQQIYNQTM